MTNSSDIKALIPATCPHCNETIVVEFISSAPKLIGVITVAMIEDAKSETVKRIQELNVLDEVSAPVIQWINSPDTIFGPNDIDTIVKNIQKQHDTPQEDIA